MFGDCQELFQHAVMKSESTTNNSPRASIVFKKSLPGIGGKRGHTVVKQIEKQPPKEQKQLPSKAISKPNSNKPTSNAIKNNT